MMMVGGSAIAKAMRQMESDNITVVDAASEPVYLELNGYDHERILKKPVTHLDNQSFIQQKMQGKRRVY
jgi:hypothetical protein